MRRRQVLEVALAAIAAIAVALSGGGAAAQGGKASKDRARALEGVVVQVERGEVIVDLGRAEGLKGESLVQVYRRVEVKHPVSGKVVVDRFPIGAMVLDQVGSVLSISTRWGSLDRTPAVGDFVVYEPVPEPPEPEPAVAEAPEPEGGAGEAPAPVKPVDPALADLERIFKANLGEPLTDRIAAWEGWMSDHPDSDYVSAVGDELNWLRDKLADEREARADMADKRRQDAPIAATVSVPREVDGRRAFELVAAVADPGRVEAVRVLLRRQGAVNYETVAMERDGDYYWRLVVPARFREPGTLEGVIEAVRHDGKLEPLSGTPSSPRRISIRQVDADPAPVQDRSRAYFVAEAVDFNSGGAIDDHYFRLEGDFRYRVDASLLRAVRVGVGLFDGVGGDLQQLQSGAEARALDVSYGYIGAEVAFHEYVGLTGVVLLGNLGGGSRLESSAGFRGMLRVGEGEGTNLELGAALTEGVGNEGWITFNLAAIDRVPMEASVVVTNLPVGEDLGVSLSYGAGYALTDWFALLGRVGWNARTINDFGPSFGLATTLTW